MKKIYDLIKYLEGKGLSKYSSNINKLIKKSFALPLFLFASGCTEDKNKNSGNVFYWGVQESLGNSYQIFHTATPLNYSKVEACYNIGESTGLQDPNKFNDYIENKSNYTIEEKEALIRLYNDNYDGNSEQKEKDEDLFGGSLGAMREIKSAVEQSGCSVVIYLKLIWDSNIIFSDILDSESPIYVQRIYLSPRI